MTKPDMRHLKSPCICLSFDLEEFDIPLEYGSEIDMDEQLAVATQGIEALLAMLNQLDVTCTFFITGVFAKAQPEVVRRIAERHEIASHSLYHSQFETSHLAESRQLLEDISGQPVVGFRRARLAQTSTDAIHKAGYIYDSSINPTYLPGRYNNLREPRRLHRLPNGLWELPISTMPWTRLPIFWLSLKNLPMGLLNFMARRAIHTDGYLNTFAHPWEFTSLSNYTVLPSYTRKPDGQALLDRYATMIEHWKTLGTFKSMREIIPD